MNLNGVIPFNGLLQEIRIRQGRVTPFYLDSKTTVFVATSDTAARKSVWLMRHVKVLREGVDDGEIGPEHISEKMMRADPNTKYLTYDVWARHMRYQCNTD